MRHLTREGIHWTVHEVDTSNVPGARACRCLLLESDDVVRRIWLYPPNWAALGDDTLWAVVDGIWSSHGAERESLEGHAGASRDELRRAAMCYASALKRDGVPPERALVLLKAAVQRGLGGLHRDDDTGDDIIRETVACCISTYYAA